MSFRLRLASAACLVAASWGLGALASPFPMQVPVESGTLQGSVADGVLSFKGFPFAAPPVGDLRWRPPQMATPWGGVRLATQYGHDCMQNPFPGDAAPLGTPPAEDCLMMNIWRPAENERAKLPVMVWIYGGGFVNGGSSPAVYSGAQFAKQGLVFVSFNYRLGRFGFFGFPALTKAHPEELKGDYGYMDQIAALKWVKRNIAAFGGDPDKVTVFGESAGGNSVSVLLTSPMAKGLFQRAGVESGGGRVNFGSRRLSEDLPGTPSAEAVGAAFAKSVGINGVDDAALKALRTLTADQVCAGLNMATMMQRGPVTYSGPIVDGKIVLGDPGPIYAAGGEAKTPLLIGANSADIGFNFARTLDEVLAPFGAEAAVARTVYDPDKTGDIRAVGARVAMDKMMIEPARFVAAAFASQGIPVYEYRFAYVADSMQAQWKSGAPHATEIPYVFDTVSAKYGDKLTAKDEGVAKAANSYWANFAKTGDPNGHGLPHWLQFDPKTDKLLDFRADGVVASEADPFKARLDLTANATDRKSQ